MDDLISRQTLKQTMYHEAFEIDTEMQKWDGGCWIRYKLFEKIVDILPSVQPKQKTGRWIYMKDCEDWFCSNCKDIFMLLEGTPKDNDYNYCPNCGAKMRMENG